VTEIAVEETAATEPFEVVEQMVTEPFEAVEPTPKAMEATLQAVPNASTPRARPTLAQVVRTRDAELAMVVINLIWIVACGVGSYVLISGGHPVWGSITAIGVVLGVLGAIVFFLEAVRK
jgi:hypothetical protein